MKTKHAITRQQQRGIKNIHLSILEIFGEEKKAPGGVTKVFLPKKKKKELIKALQSFANQEMILGPEGQVLTVQHSI